MQPEYDAALEALLDANALRPGETQESIIESEHDSLREEEKNTAQNAVKQAEKAVSAAQSALENAPEKQSKSRKAVLVQAKKNLKTARAAARMAKRHWKLIDNFHRVAWPLRMAKESAKNHQILLS